MKSCKIHFGAAMLAILCGIATGCGGGSGTPPPPAAPPSPSISISPSAATVPAGGTQQFQAFVSNATNTAVTWQVNGIAGGDSKVGTISSLGLYTAPAMLTTPAQMTVTAILQADTSKSASATVSIPAIMVTISPFQPIIEVGSTMQFLAFVSGSVDQTVAWQVNGKPGGDATVGTITSSGMYTAPASVSDATTVTVSAISAADSSKSGSTAATVVPVIAVTVSPASATLPAGASQQFTATVQGVSNQSVSWDIAGQCDEDGVCDPNVGSITGGGLYLAPPYPPGTVTICASSNVNPAKGACADVKVTFSNASLDGSYAFFLRGQNAAGELMIAGSFTADGAGNLQNGVEDIVNPPNKPITKLAFTGSYSVEPDGRGTATITSSQGTSTLRFLLVDGAGLCCSFAAPGRKALVIEFDSLAVAEGEIERQFGSSGLFHGIGNSADFAFGLSGFGPSGKIVAAGRFTSNAGLGASGPISAGLEDLNNAGSVTMSESFTGTYDENTFSRGTLTLSGAFGNRNFAYYPGDTGIVIIGLDPGFSVLGRAEMLFSLDFAGPLGNSVLNSQFVIERTGIAAGVPFVSLGQFTANGVGGINMGIADENAGGIVSEDVSFTGTYALAATGRGTAALTTAGGNVNLSFYVTGSQSALRAFFVQTDSSAVNGGIFDSLVVPSLSNTGAAGLVVSNILPSRTSTLGLVQIGSGNLSGVADVNDSGVTLSGVDITGIFSLSNQGRGTATINTPGGSLRLRLYSSLSSNFFLFQIRMIGLNPGEQQVGSLRQQF